MFDRVTIDDVYNFISFEGKESSFKGDNKIPELQTKGVTAICNILNKQQYAYLADEVGMGKTYQSIGVIAMLLKEKPNAKVLIIAPNRRVQNNWVTEIQNFINNNLRDDTSININPISFPERKDFLDSFNKKNSNNIYLTRLTTFSTIAYSIINNGNNNDYDGIISTKELIKGLNKITNSNVSIKNIDFDAFNSGIICGEFLRYFTPFYDLIIIDEAQNIRNENNATAFLNYWLGLKRNFGRDSNIDEILKKIENCLDKKKNKNDSKFLLLSATPAHRNIDSLRRQLLYFDNPKLEDINHKYLENFLIRRLRRYNDENKYSIRHIIPTDVLKELEKDSSENLLEQKLFLALVQSKLAKEGISNNSTFKIGFLETFESYSPSSSEDKKIKEAGKEFENGGFQEKGEKGEAPDKLMLKNLNESFTKADLGRDTPPHPKYSFMENEVENLVKQNLFFENKDSIVPDKAVIFVRRLASVSELEEKRLNPMYERKIVSYWGGEFKIQNATLKDIQNRFETKYNSKTDNEDIDDSGNIQDYESDNQENGKIKLFKWLALKKQHVQGEYNAVSKFKKSILSNRTNSFMFDENYFFSFGNKTQDDLAQLVGEDIVEEINEYIIKESGRYIADYKDKRNYTELLHLCCYVALKHIGKEKIAEYIKSFYGIGEKVKTQKSGDPKLLNKEDIINILKQDSIWNHMSEYKVKAIYDCNDFKEFCKREVLKGLTEKYLKSSEAILEFMYCYIKVDNKDHLCENVMKRLFNNNLTHGQRIRKLFEKENRDLVYKQVFGGDKIENESELGSKLSFFNMQQWVMPAIGGNKGNEGLIKRFNTPFYPDIIVCTDVLKEGINLHLFCNRIFHYGLAWTPGDLEQRIGRIDRFFSQTHRERANQESLPKDKKMHIEINYPYVGKSVDEHQLKQVLKFKLSADPLLDSKDSMKKDIQNDLEEQPIDDLAKYVPETIDNEPYDGKKFWDKKL